MSDLLINELPPLTFSAELTAAGTTTFVAGPQESDLVVDYSSLITNAKITQEQEASGTEIETIDWRDHETFKSKKEDQEQQAEKQDDNNNDQLPDLISHLDVEPCSGFLAHLLCGSMIQSTRKKQQKQQKGQGGGGEQQQNNNNNNQKQDEQNRHHHHHHHHANKKQAAASQQTRKGQGLANRGEIPTSTAGPIVNIKEDEFKEDWYAMLGLTDDSVNENELKSAFRRRCLETHPDKCKGNDELFKKVQRAMEILGNAEARKQYDSSREFDDSIPPDGVEYDDDPKKFIETYKPVFARNARWSVQPVTVQLGDEKTSLKDVQRFYDFWLSFRSWRDFSHVAELEEIQEGMCREEKRYYQRENERVLNLHKKDELKRVRQLVEQAMRCDPRIRSEQRRIEKEREDAIRAKEEEKMKAELEKSRLEREEKEKGQKAEREAKEAKEKARVLLKETKQKTVAELRERGILDPDGGASLALVEDSIRGANIEWLFTKLGQGKDPVALSAKILGESGASKEAVISGFNKLVKALEGSLGVTRYGEPCAKTKPVAGLTSSSPASSPEKSSSSASAATAASSPSTSSPSSSSAAKWEEEDIILLTKAIAKYPGGTVDRWRRISVMLRDKFSEEQVLTKTKELEQANKSGGSLLASGGATSAMAASSIAVSGAPTNTAPEEDWNAKQQQQLEEGLRKMKEYKEKDKFMKIAEFVPGKTAKQCYERFKHLCAMAKKK